jgi:hypothetical protein
MVEVPQMHQVRLRDGRIAALRDDEVMPDGATLITDVMLLDSMQREVRDADEVEDGEDIELTPDQRRAILYGPARQLSDAEAAEERRAKAYYDWRDRLNTANRPGWRYSKERPPKAGPWPTPPAHDRSPQRRDGPPVPGCNDAAARAYDARNARLESAWKKGKSAGPVLDRHGPSAAWLDGGRPSLAVGGAVQKGRGFSPYQRGGS